jgi:hypothetical protein
MPRKKNKFSDQINDILISGRDTTFLVDENGKKYMVISENKIEEIDNSINGFVKYRYNLFNGNFTYDKHRNKTKTIYKEEYFRRDLRVYINDDTLDVGQQFHGTAWINKPTYTIEVEEPLRTVITINNNDRRGVFEYSCTEAGVFTFRGKIVYDSIQSFPFEYKFLVVKKDPS